MKRILSLLLALVTVFALVSCSKNGKMDENVVITVGETKIPTAAFFSELYGYKNDFLFNYLGVEEDNELIWSQDSPSTPNESVGENLKRIALEDMMQFAWVVEYARLNGAVLSEDDQKQIDDAIAQTKEGFETEEEYNEYLTMLTFAPDNFRDYLELTLLYDKGFSLLVGENGLYPIPDEDYYKYYEENFATVKHIFINNISKENEDGTVEHLTNEEKKAQEERADQILADLEAGASFDSLYILSEDQMATLYPDGVTYSTGMINSEYEEVVNSLNVGEYKKYEGTNGGIYIIMKMELSESDYEEYYEYVATAVQSNIQTKIYDEHKDEIEVNYDVVNSLKMKDIPVTNYQINDK